MIEEETTYGIFCRCRFTQEGITVGCAEGTHAGFVASVLERCGNGRESSEEVAAGKQDRA